MKEYEIQLNDWTRIFAEDAPPAFYLEIILRATYLFILLIASMRILGKRMAAQLSRNEMAAMVSLAAAIGIPMLTPERGLIPGTIVAVIVIGISKLSARINFNNPTAEQLTIGDVGIIIEDGILNRKEMVAINLPRERIMSQLRQAHITHLGEVKRLYLESTGDFSLITEPHPSPGLLALPSGDKEFIDRMVDYSDDDICLQCGTKQDERAKSKLHKCENCGASEFTKAVISKT